MYPHMFVLVRPPASDVRPVLMAVFEGASGIVKTLSMTWTTPPSNMTSAVVTGNKTALAFALYGIF